MTSPKNEASAEAGLIFADFAAGELKLERERRVMLDQRGITVITSSSTLVTILSGLAALTLVRPTTYRPTAIAVASFALAILFLATASLYALLANRSRFYSVVDESSILSLREDDAWGLSAGDARWLIIGLNVKTLTTVRAGNITKSRHVNRALLAQLVAIMFLAIAVLAETLRLLLS
ncbi:hypothetical protein AB0M02_06820 [Actinoplanes sp. NPDC051861]|uniref:hypothetical protein n=1 Tax=Actinoplanes sp. NPDC051861 TaxID=3155170 RepID=UPI003417F8AE